MASELDSNLMFDSDQKIDQNFFDIATFHNFGQKLCTGKNFDFEIFSSKYFQKRSKSNATKKFLT